MNKIGRGINIVQDQGFEPLLAHTVSSFGFSIIHDFILYYRWGFEKNPKQLDLNLIQIHIDKLKYTNRFPFANTGKDALVGTAEGNWDSCKIPLIEHSVYKALEQRFEYGVDWEKLELYQQAMKKIKNGKTYWNGCATKSDLKTRCEKIDRLYYSIKNNGYKSQSDLYKEGYKIERTQLRHLRLPDELRVAVDRNGDLIRVGSAKHRIIIAKLLGLDIYVPAIVQIRHNKCNNKLPYNAQKLTTEHELVEEIT